MPPSLLIRDASMRLAKEIAVYRTKMNRESHGYRAARDGEFMTSAKTPLMTLCALLWTCLSLGAAETTEWRGYYLTFMRMPVMGLPEWKQSMDCFAEDGA